MCPYSDLAKNPHTINESNDFVQVALETCEESAKQDDNTVILNESTDGVSCELEWNKSLTLAYLDGDNNHIFLLDPNHNANNLRYQLIGGSSPSTIGNLFLIHTCLF